MKRFFNNYWIKSGFFTLSQRLSIRLLGIVSFIVLVRLINEDQMGVWSLFLGLATMLDMLRNGLIKTSFVKYYSESSPEEQKAIKTAGLILNLIYSAITSIILFFGSDLMAALFNAPELAEMFRILSITVVLAIFFSHFEYLQQGAMSFKGIMWSYITKQGVLFILILASLTPYFANLTTFKLSLFHLFGVASGGLVSFLFTKKMLTYTFIYNRPWIQKLWRFGRYGMATNLGSSLLTTADQYLIAGLINTRSVGIYNVAVRTTNLFIMPSVAIADILYPKTVRSMAEKGTKEVKKLYENAVGATLAALIPAMIIVLLVPEFIIKLVAGDSYIMAKDVLRISILTIIIRPFITQFGTIINTLGKPKLNFLFVLGLALLGICLNYLLITAMGYIGAAIANLCTLTVGLVISQMILHKEAEISFKEVLRCTGKYLTILPQKLLTKIRK
ncbi:MAG: flippase [Bacteroidota bacterium]